MPKFRKEDITFHSDGFRDSRPAVNVKVHDTLAQGFAKWQADEADPDPRFTVEWIETNLSDEQQQRWFEAACECGWEDAQNDAEEVFGKGAKVYSEGRMGGWLVVHGIDDDVSQWDAIAVSRWAKFARWARGTADYTMARMVELIYINVFDAWTVEESERIGGEAFAPEAMRAAMGG